MLLKEKGEFVLDEKQLAFIMNKFSISIWKSLNSKEDGGSRPVTLKEILIKFIFHSSIDKFRKTSENNK